MTYKHKYDNIAPRITKQKMTKLSPEARLRGAMAVTVLANLGHLALPNAASAERTGVGHPDIARKIESKGHMPADLRQLLVQIQEKTGSPVEKLAHMPYRQLAEFRAGKHQVRIVQVGGELASGPLKKEQLRTMQKNIQMFEAFSRSGAKATMPFYEVNSANIIQRSYEGHFSIGPINKDKVVFVVPARVNIGEFQGIPDTFTQTKGREVASFVRPDLPNGFEGVLTEACQANVQVELDRLALFGIKANAQQMDGIEGIGQENICNALARAIYDREHGLSFSDYQTNRGSRVDTGYTNNPSISENAFVATMPILRSAHDYNSLNHEIPRVATSRLSWPHP